MDFIFGHDSFKEIFWIPDAALFSLIIVGFFYFLCFKDKKIVTLRYIKFLLFAVSFYVFSMYPVQWLIGNEWALWDVNLGTVYADHNSYVITRLMVALPWLLFLVLLYIDTVNNSRESLELPFLSSLLFWFFIIGTMVYNYFLLFVIMEAVTLSIVIIAGIVLSVTRTKSLKALLQFLVLNLSVSTFYLLGVAILLWLAPHSVDFTLNYEVVSAIFADIAADNDYDKTVVMLCVKLAMALIIVPIVFKLTLAPFSVWIATIYSELPVIVLFIVMTVYKAVYVLIFVRLFIEAVNLVPELASFWTDSMFLFVLPSMFVGCFAYRVQDLKTVLALTTVSQMGYIMSGLIVQSPIAGSYSMIYLVTYCFQLFGLLALIILLQNKFDIVNLAQLFLIKRYSALCYWSLFVIFLSLAGLPPFAGFFTKYFLFLSLYSSGNVVLAMAGLASSVLMAIIYLQMTLQLITVKESHSAFTFDQTAKNTLFVERDSVYEYMRTLVKGFLVFLLVYNILFSLVLPEIYNIAYDFSFHLYNPGDIMYESDMSRIEQLKM
jgi:NADH-quinone oxidoreductase subunit N